jgi:hypothetical protein
MKTISLIWLALFVLLAACGEDEVSYSAPVGIKLSISSGDIDRGQIFDEKNINTESGNPYGAFIADARAKLDGADPSALRLDRLTLQVDSTSKNVTMLGQVFGGRTELSFIMNGTETVVPVGSLDVTASTGVGPVEMDVGFDSSKVSGADWTSFLGGQFKLRVQGPAAATFASANADANMTATLEFTALE